MKILFSIPPVHGHINPTLPVAHELVARGEEVIYYLTDGFKERVERTGAVFRRIDNTFEPSQEIPKIQGGLQVGQMVETRDIMPLFARYITDSLSMLPKLLDRVRMEKPDFVVYDPMCLWGHSIAKILGIPAATFYVISPMTKDSPLVHQMLSGVPPLKVMPTMFKLLWTTWKLHLRYELPLLNPTDMLTLAEDLNIISVPRQFQPETEIFDDRYKFIGPSVLPSMVDYDVEFPFDQFDGRPILYIALGTAFYNRPDFFKTCIDTFANTGWLVVIATWKKLELGQLPSNFIVRPCVPQLKVLQRTNVFITHGGMGSVMGALFYGIPMVVVPQMPENNLNADCVAELGLGVRLEPDANAEALRDAVNTVHTDPGYRNRMVEMQTAMQEAGGYRRAAEEIQNFLYSSVQISRENQSKVTRPQAKLT